MVRTLISLVVAGAVAFTPARGQDDPAHASTKASDPIPDALLRLSPDDMDRIPAVIKDLKAKLASIAAKDAGPEGYAALKFFESKKATAWIGQLMKYTWRRDEALECLERIRDAAAVPHILSALRAAVAEEAADPTSGSHSISRRGFERKAVIVVENLLHCDLLDEEKVFGSSGGRAADPDQVRTALSDFVDRAKAELESRNKRQ